MRLLTINEVSVILGVSTVTLRAWEKKGKLIPEVRVGNRKDRLYNENAILEAKEKMYWRGKFFKTN